MPYLNVFSFCRERPIFINFIVLSAQPISILASLWEAKYLTSQSHSYSAIYQITYQELPTRNLDFFLLIFYRLIQSSIIFCHFSLLIRIQLCFLYRNIWIGNLNEDDFIFGISLQYAIANSHSALKTVPLRLPKEKLLWNWFGPHILINDYEFNGPLLYT